MSENVVEATATRPKRIINTSQIPLGPDPYRRMENVHDDPKIDALPIEEREAGKVERVKGLDLRTVLTDLFGPDEKYKSLIDSTVKYTQQFMPLLSLIGGPPNDPGEGRGSYKRVPLPLPGGVNAASAKSAESENEGAIFYGKGVGSRDLLLRDGQTGKHPGFAATAKDAFHDTPGGVIPRARINGAAAYVECVYEFVNAAVIFAETAKRENWKDVSEAVADRVTIPVGVLRFPELSAEQWQLAQQRAAIADPKDKEFFSWEENKYLASVGLIVPDTKRKTRNDGNKDRFAEESLNPKIALTTARTLRRLLDAGIVYTDISAHGQNIYQEGLMAQADNEDLEFLGDYHDDKNDKKDKRGVLIYEMLNGGLIPLSEPTAKVPFDAVEKIQQVFWEELLRGIVPEAAIRELPKLMPFFKEQINLALSKLFAQRSQSLAEGTDERTEGSAAHWESVAQSRQKMLSKNGFKPLPATINNTKIEDFKTLTGVNDPLGVDAILQFLSGDQEKISFKDPKLQSYLEVTEAIFGIRDTRTRDRLISSMSTLMIERKPTVGGTDIIELFDNKHLSCLQKLIQSKQYGEAEEMIRVLTDLRKLRSLETYLTTDEYPSTQYALKLLQLLDEQPDKTWGLHGIRNMFKKAIDTESLKEMSNQVNVITDLFEFIQRTTSSHGGVSTIMADLLTAAMKEKVGNLEIASKTKKSEIAKGFVNFVSSIKTYFEYLNKLDKGDERIASAEELIGYLEEKLHEIQQEFPELAYGHNLMMSDYFSTKDHERAQKYFDKAENYHTILYEKRKEELGINPDGTSTDPANFSDEQKARFASYAEKYRGLGFTKVADFYQGQINRE